MSKIPKQKSSISIRSMEAVILIQSAFRSYVMVKEKNRRDMLSIKREEIVRELLQTEKDYLSTLRTLEMSFLNRIHDHKDAEKIFSKRADLRERTRRLALVVRDIISHHDSFLANFNYSVSKWHVNKRIGEFFQQMITYRKSYSTYSKEYIHLWATIKNDSSLMKTLASVIDQGEGMHIEEFLHAPVVRVTQISKLLPELLENTWNEHCDYKYLAAGVVNTNNLYETVDMLSKKAICEERKQELLCAFSLPKGFEFDLADSEEIFLWEHLVNVFGTDLSTGESMVELFDVHLFAFKNVLLLGTKSKSREKFRIRHHIPKDAIADQKNISGSEPYHVLITGPTKWTFQKTDSSVPDVLDYIETFVGLSNPRKLRRSTSKRLSRNISLKTLKGALSSNIIIRKKVTKANSSSPDKRGNSEALRRSCGGGNERDKLKPQQLKPGRSLTDH